MNDYGDEDYQMSEAEQAQVNEYKERYSALSADIASMPDVAELYFQRGQLVLRWDYWSSYGDLPYDKEMDEADGMSDLNRAIELAPANVEYRGARAEQYEQHRHYEQAITDYNHILELEPTNLKYLLALAQLYDHHLFAYPTAIAAYSRLIEVLEARPDGWEVEWNSKQAWPNLRGSLANAYAARAMCYYQSQKYAPAIADYTILIEHGAIPTLTNHPMEFKSYYVPRAWCYAALGQHGKAAADYSMDKGRGSDEAQAKPSHSKELHEYEQAVAKYTATIQQMERMQGQPATTMNPNSVLGSVMGEMMNSLVGGNANDRLAAEYRERAKAYMGQGQFEQAAADYRRATELAHFRSNYDDMIHAGNATAEAGRREDAIYYYTQAIEGLLEKLEHPERKAAEHQSTVTGMMGKMVEQFTQRFGNNDRVQQITAQVMGSIGNLPQQTGRALSMVRMNYYPMLATAYFNRATTYSKLKRHAEALMDYTSGLELDPDNASAYNDRANAYRGLEQYAQAFTDYARAIQLDPDNSLAYNNRGGLYAKVGRFDEALADLTQALQLDPEGSHKLYNMAFYHAQRHDGEQAIAYLKRAIAAEPELRKNAQDPDEFGWLVKNDAAFAAEFRKLVGDDSRLD